MSKVTFFLQECPTCGRGLEVRVEYLGKKVACQHCGGRFVAKDPSTTESEEVVDSYSTLLRRVDELLAQTAPLARES